MNTIALGTCFGVSALILAATGALGEDRLTGKVSVTALSSSCPSTLALANQAVPVNFLLPDSGNHAQPPVQNRFRFNNNTAVTAARSVTISGKIEDYGAPGCTVAFSGNGLSVD